MEFYNKTKHEAIQMKNSKRFFHSQNKGKKSKLQLLR